ASTAPSSPWAPLSSASSSAERSRSAAAAAARPASFPLRLPRVMIAAGEPRGVDHGGIAVRNHFPRFSLAGGISLALLAFLVPGAGAAVSGPASLDFGRQPAFTISPPRTLTVTKEPMFTTEPIALDNVEDHLETFHATSNCPALLTPAAP